jgi:hypothetical protein
MSDQHDSRAPDQGTKPQAGRTPKKPYRKPEFRHERVFETSALNCGKVNGSQGACASVRKNS